MENYLNRVSLGEVVFAKEKGLSPGSNHAIALLTKIGFLYENQEGQLHFSSAMHCKIWLKTTRKEPLNHLLKNSRLEDFMISTIGRMSSNRLSSISLRLVATDLTTDTLLMSELYNSIECSLITFIKIWYIQYIISNFPKSSTEYQTNGSALNLHITCQHELALRSPCNSFGIADHRIQNFCSIELSRVWMLIHSAANDHEVLQLISHPRPGLSRLFKAKHKKALRN
ncbi:hypothetical protein BC833DRAFT_662954 [Globomyces pollinis-pini]|nr:hypothetical protein BC833DRAFT_662954 [Globomyces pollinis-pini]